MHYILINCKKKFYGLSDPINNLLQRYLELETNNNLLSGRIHSK